MDLESLYRYSNTSNSSGLNNSQINGTNRVVSDGNILDVDRFELHFRLFQWLEHNFLEFLSKVLNVFLDRNLLLCWSFLLCCRLAISFVISQWNVRVGSAFSLSDSSSSGGVLSPPT